MLLNKIYCGDSLAVLKTFPDKSVNCCVTSPPYWNLRDYGVEGQIGLEPSIGEYIEKLVVLFREVRRVLRDDATQWLNLGDTFGNKQLLGIPWKVAFALQSDGWYLRQDIIWAKTNPMPESVQDRCTKSHEYIFLFSKTPHYYFNAGAIAEPVADSTVKRLSQDIENQAGSDRVPGKTNGNMKAKAPRYGGKKYTDNPEVFNRTKSGNAYEFRAMRNKRSVWTVSTQPFKEAHFATFPPKLIEPCILAGCPEGGIVLDPFMGSGTTGIVAKQNGRNYIGIELNEQYIKEIAEPRLAECLF